MLSSIEYYQQKYIFIKVEVTMNLNELSKDELIKLIEDNENVTGKYGLVWDKEKEPEKIVTECDKNIPILIEEKSKDITNGIVNNIIIEGDNFHSLSVLNYTHPNLVDVIYIDPPYNTGKKDFIYNDKFIDTEDGYRHSKWLNFMEKRLKLSRDLLKDSGVIFISIDDNEVAQLKLLCNKIFGENNFISMLSVENNPKGRKNSNFISISNEYCLIYAKNKSESYFIENIPKAIDDMTKDENGNYVQNGGRRVLVGENKFNDNISDFNSKKHYTVYYSKELNDMVIKKENDIHSEDINLVNNGYVRYYSYNDNGFVLNTYSSDKLKEKFDNDELDFKDNKIYEKNYTTTIRLKTMVTNKKYEAVIDNKKVKYEIDVKTTSAGTHLKELFNTIKIPFDNPKNVGLLKLLISLIEDKNITILDFFAGSGTTGEAVLELNAGDGGNRKFILCTNNENNICSEITYPRLKTVITGKRTDGSIYSSGLKANLKYYKTDFVENTNNRDQLYFDLTEKCIPMLCMKSECFNEYKSTDEYKIFSNEDKN
jgi:adenine-specific DNA-methyltransferase